MKSLSILIALFLAKIQCANITLIAPNFQSKHFKAQVSAFEEDLQTSVAVLINDKIWKVQADGDVISTELNKIKPKQKIKLIVKTEAQCLVDEQILAPTHNDYITIIRLDKPIYKPDEEIKIFVAVLDPFRRPFAFEKLTLDVIDNKNERKETFNFIRNETYAAFGVVTKTFKLPLHSKGIWKVKVHVNDNKKASIKHFNIKKSDSTPKNTLLLQSRRVVSYQETAIKVKILSIDINRNPPTGTIKVIAFVFNGKNVQIAKTHKKINCGNSTTQEVLFSFKNDFKLQRVVEEMMIRFEAVFIDSLTNERTDSNKITARLITGEHYFMDLFEPKCISGFAFGARVRVYDIEGKHLTGRRMMMHIKYRFSNGTRVTYTDTNDRGEMYHVIQTNRDTKSMIIELETGKFRTSKNVLCESNYDAFKATVVEEVNSSFTVLIESYKDISRLYIMIANHEGILYSFPYNFKNKKSGKIEFNKVEDMNFNSRLIAYYTTTDGSSSFGFETLNFGLKQSDNFLNITGGHEAKIGKEYQLNIETTPESLVFITGFDREHYFSDKSNDNYEMKIKLEELYKNTFSKYESTDSMLKKFNLLKLEPKYECNEHEINLIKTLESKLSLQSSEPLHIQTPIEVHETVDNVRILQNEIEQDIEIDVDKNEFVQNVFPEVWIYDDFFVNNTTTLRMYNVTNYRTKMRFLGLSIHPNKGLVFSNPFYVHIVKAKAAKTNKLNENLIHDEGNIPVNNTEVLSSSPSNESVTDVN